MMVLTLSQAAAYLAAHGYTIQRPRAGIRGPVRPDTLKHWLLRDADKPECDRRFPHAVKVGTGNRATWHIPQADLDAFLARDARPHGRARPVTIDGVLYPSQSEAARAMGVTRQAINQRATLSSNDDKERVDNNDR